MDNRLKQVLSHPKRVEIFNFLTQVKNGERADEQELAEVFGMGIRQVEYHLKVLHDADLIVA